MRTNTKGKGGEGKGKKMVGKWRERIEMEIKDWSGVDGEDG